MLDRFGRTNPGAALALVLLLLAAVPARGEVKYFDVAKGARPHDVAAAPNGGVVYYTAQATGKLGILDPATGKFEEIPLGPRSAPHGVIVGPDNAAWITDGGQNAIVRVDAATKAVKVFPLPADTGYTNLNTATFDRKGRIWFTGQSGYHGRLDPANGDIQVWKSPRGRGPYGITTTPGGDVYYASLAGNHIAKIDTETGAATVIEPPTKSQGARRVWSDSRGQIWVSEWNAGQVSRYDPRAGAWKTWKLPGDRPQTYAVYVDDQDKVWLSDWGSNSMVRFDPDTERFETFRSESKSANVRQLLGQPGEVWVPESGADRLLVFRTR